MATKEVVAELVGFLSDSRAEARQIATSNVAGLTASEDGLKLLTETPGVVKLLAQRIGDVSPICDDAIKSLINLCAAQGVFDQLINVSNIFEMLMENILVGELPILRFTRGGTGSWHLLHRLTSRAARGAH